MTRIALIGCHRAEDYAAIVSRVPGVELVANSRACDAVIAHGADHAEIRQLAQAGKHLLIEMPIAASTSEADELIAFCRSSGVVLMAGQSSRYLPSIQAVKTSLDSGQLGEPGLLRIHRWLASGTRKQTTADFRNAIVRELDLAMWLFGSTPTDVYSVSTRRDDDTDETVLSVQIHLGFREAMSIIDATQSDADYYSLTMIGSTGAAYADDHHNTQLLSRDGNVSAIKTSTGNLHLLAQLKEFVSAIGEKRQPAITGADGQAAIHVADAAIRSLESRKALHPIDGEYTTSEDR